MLSFLCLGASCFQMTCGAPFKTPEPIPNANLFSVSLFINNGIRVPYNILKKREEGSWYCDSDTSAAPRINFVNNSGATRRIFNPFSDKQVEFPPNCQPGDLTVQGMEQHQKLGAKYREYLIDKYNFLPENIDNTLLNLHSTFDDSTFRSAESFLSTFYPPMRPFENIEIYTGTDSGDFLQPTASFCKDLKDAFSSFKASNDFQTKKQQSSIIYQKFFENYNKTIDETNWLYIGDSLSSYYCTDQVFPEVVTNEVFEQAMKDYAYSLYGWLGEKSGAAAAPMLREIINKIDDQIKNGAPERFHLYSVNSTAIAGIINAFGVSEDHAPFFASHINVEIWKTQESKYVLRIIYNGDEINIGEEGSRIEFNAFKTFVAKYLSFCSEL